MSHPDRAGDRSRPGQPGAIRRVCVYCGSSKGRDPSFAAAAAELGRCLVQERVGLVYGGGDVGLMGMVARAVLAGGGEVLGIIPDFLRRREQMVGGTQQTVVVPDMHARKQMMFEESDAFVALPGGVGTLEELVEQMTWAQLGRHRKPILLLDIGGFWDPLLILLDHMREHGFIRSDRELNYAVARRPDEVLPMLRAAAAEAGGPGEPAEDLHRLF